MRGRGWGVNDGGVRGSEIRMMEKERRRMKRERE